MQLGFLIWPQLSACWIDFVFTPDTARPTVGYAAIVLRSRRWATGYSFPNRRYLNSKFESTLSVQ